MSAPAAALAPSAPPWASLVAIRAARLEDMPYIHGSFSEGRKLAPGLSSMSWRSYKEHVVPRQREVFAHPETRVLAAYLPAGPTIIGWLAYWPRKTVSVVHWVHVRYTIAARGGEPEQPYEGDKFRRAGVMRALFSAAQLGRIAYTHKGGRAKHDRDGKTADERLLPWLREHGHHPVYQPWEACR